MNARWCRRKGVEFEREVRRRLALGAATGGYLVSPAQYAQDRGAQSA